MPKSAFGFEKPEHSPGFLLWQTTITWQRLIKHALDEHDISHAQFVIMACLLWFEEHDVDSTQVAIVRQTKLDKMTVSKSLRVLASQGLVSRSEHEHDTRAKLVKLTAQGKKLVRKLVPIVEGIDEKLFGVLKKEEGNQIIDIFVKLVQPSGNSKREQ